ncbi:MULTISPECIES: hypothetical protein [Kurthia]|uniref:Transposase n=1 Tax=Kurthia populi TaxID=1562132 RepID=A0ABW5Y383_9BACL|nr:MULTISPECIES: hypothetical protein [unclassified Kurthia]HIX43937.1 hypothetical protein [Candidatus Kurthia intestinigallinarum]
MTKHYPSRLEKAQAKRQKERSGKLAIFRYAADIFRAVDTVYRLFRMML